jgi:hypothetical protein
MSIATLKNRTLSPIVERFLVCVRGVAASLAGKHGPGGPLVEIQGLSAKSRGRFRVAVKDGKLLIEGGGTLPVLDLRKVHRSFSS